MVCIGGGDRDGGRGTGAVACSEAGSDLFSVVLGVVACRPGLMVPAPVAGSGCSRPHPSRVLTDTKPTQSVPRTEWALGSGVPCCWALDLAAPPTLEAACPQRESRTGPPKPATPGPPQQGPGSPQHPGQARSLAVRLARGWAAQAPQAPPGLRASARPTGRALPATPCELEVGGQHKSRPERGTGAPASMVARSLKAETGPRRRGPAQLRPHAGTSAALQEDSGVVQAQRQG